MVQGYPKADNSCSGFGGPSPESEIQEKLSPLPERNPEVVKASFSYRTSNLGGYPHELHIS